MSTVNISDQDLANIILTQTKMSATSMTNLILESASDTLRRDATNILQSTFTNQQEVFDIMSQKGWYQTQSASTQDVATAKQSVSSIQTSI